MVTGPRQLVVAMAESLWVQGAGRLETAMVIMS